jgi:lipoyl(octanoyl) transferase
MSKIIAYTDLGLIDYRKAWDLQTELLKSSTNRKQRNRELAAQGGLQEAIQHYFLLCQHPHVYTLGRNGSETHLLADAAELERIGATFVKINRGGDITYHGQGQIVGYPILDLDDFFTDIARYIRGIEEIIIRTIAEYGLIGERIVGESGVWLHIDSPRPCKICAIGVHLSRWITMHGFALNVNTDLSYFEHIIPCGLRDKGVTSMAQELGKTVDLAEVEAKIVRHAGEFFGATMQAYSSNANNELKIE